MIEQQIELIILFADFNRDLAADEGEAYTQLNEKLPQVCEEPAFEIAFPRFRCQGEEIEVVGIFDELPENS